MPNVRMTGPTRAVLSALLARGGRTAYGLEISAETGLASGTIHPILARLEGLGWVSSDWEEIDPSEAGRPRRRYYRLTGVGGREAEAVLAGHEAARNARRARLVPAGNEALT